MSNQERNAAVTRRRSVKVDWMLLWEESGMDIPLRTSL